jgi:hypothetical protein
MRSNRAWRVALVFTAAFATEAAADPINILFVGNSFTHGRYPPALNYNAGAANSGTGVVHDLLCPTAGCGGTVEGAAPVNPSQNPPPGATLSAQLTYLQNNPSSQYSEVGPFAGAAGIFLQFTKDAGLNYNVSLIAVSSATLAGYNSGSSAADKPMIAQSTWDHVVLQDQSFTPLPTTITVNGQSVPTRGNPANFKAGVEGLVTAIDAADTAAGKASVPVTLYQTPPLAAYGYTSTNPAAPIFGTSTPAQQGGNKAYAPYVGDANPIAAMAQDLHNAYYGEAASWDTTHPTGSTLNVANAGDAWVTAIDAGIAEQNPYLVNEPAGQIDLWDSNPLLACCTTPIGYHPSVYGDYLNSLVLFDEITGVDPRTLTSEFDPTNTNSAAYALGISGSIAAQLAAVAEITVAEENPVPEPGTLCLLAAGLIPAIRSRRRR